MHTPIFKTFLVADAYAHRVRVALRSVRVPFTTHQESGYTIISVEYPLTLASFIRRIDLHKLQAYPNIAEVFGPENLDLLIELLDNSRINYTLCQTNGDCPTIFESVSSENYDIYYAI